MPQKTALHVILTDEERTKLKELQEALKAKFPFGHISQGDTIKWLLRKFTIPAAEDIQL